MSHIWCADKHKLMNWEGSIPSSACHCVFLSCIMHEKHFNGVTIALHQQWACAKHVGMFYGIETSQGIVTFALVSYDECSILYIHYTIPFANSIGFGATAALSC